MVVRKVVALIVVSKCELYNIALQTSKYMCITYLSGSIFFTFLQIYKIRVRDKSGDSKGNLIHSFGMNPVSHPSHIQTTLYTGKTIRNR